MLINDREEVLLIDSNEIPYFKEPVRRWIGYDRGRIENGDLLIWVQQKAAPLDLDRVYKRLFNEQMTRDRDQAGFLLGVGIYGEEDVQPIIKWSDGEAALNTVFNGREIAVTAKAEDGLKIILDGKRYEFELGGFGGQLVVFAGDSLKYFLPPEMDEERIVFLCKNLDFEPYIDRDRLCVQPVFLRDLLETEIYLACSPNGAALPVEQVLVWQGQRLFIRRNQLDPERQEIQISAGRDLDRAIVRLYDIKASLAPPENAERNLVLDFHSIISRSAAMRRIKDLLSRVSTTNASVLLLGESGTGKTMIAQEIHKKSKRALMPFIVINCAAIPENLIESELFGYEEGAFTGAKRTGKKGYFEMADGGTIFLDEIGELPLPSQGRLLEVLQNKSFYRVGGNKKIEVNVRIIAATNQDIERFVEEKIFRRDLFYRLNVFPVRVPPLRERLDDIDLLSRNILPRICSRLEIEPLVLSNEAIEQLKSYEWPGNVRELENVLEQAAILCEGRVIRSKHLMMKKEDSVPMDLKNQVDAFERQLIMKVLAVTGSNKAQTARVLDIGRTTLFEKMKKYNIEG